VSKPTSEAAPFTDDITISLAFPNKITATDEPIDEPYRDEPTDEETDSMGTSTRAQWDNRGDNKSKGGNNNRAMGSNNSAMGAKTT
jgi:hypothetical protein